jgi:hypothetical protein
VLLLPVIIFDDFRVGLKLWFAGTPYGSLAVVFATQPDGAAKPISRPLLPCHNIHDSSCFGNATASY